ncbi:McrC family protein [Synechococcus sp. CS-1325]|uniref:McrC family protein n=1 Tax=unclassified Synechococcus TaxID=2626047 RepID=UPI000DB70D4A|nr:MULTISPECIES: McrC family protein [unclassified Synechococcus]MCT0198595.1 McrC family protein [Synechococcus sp. CS-1325]MCT0212800.1 McrC family protein [Synechococcus sp. CS-1326]MCT0232632.1 McrC family protein [Synechococcus sp. CS-1327]PZV02147.1 MAG: restriction endonuclease [Cyanobium sp.]
MIRRTIREWERIGYGSGDAEIPEAEADRLAAIARASAFSGRGGEGVLEHGRTGLRARGVVGVIATQGCQLEILPKIEGGGETNVSDATLRARLIHMLAVTFDLPIEAGAMTKLGWQRDTLLELLIRLFCAKLTDAVRQGMPRHYLEHEDDLPALRGRLEVKRQFSTLAVSPQKLACRFDSLSSDIALNQVMRAAISKLSRLSGAQDTQRALRELSFVYVDVADVPPCALRWDRIVLDRTNGRWRNLLSFARLFLTDRYQTTSAGAIDGHALLFEMNVLFERYVERILSRALAGTGYRLSSQGGHRDCLYEGDIGRFRTRPDLIVRNTDGVKLIIDTKWKRMASRIDDPKQGVSQADVYQLMAYGRLYRCPNVVLLYPHHGDLPPDPIRRRYSIGTMGAKETLMVATQDLAGPQRSHHNALRQLVEQCLTREGRSEGLPSDDHKANFQAI